MHTVFAFLSSPPPPWVNRKRTKLVLNVGKTIGVIAFDNSLLGFFGQLMKTVVFKIFTVFESLPGGDFQGGTIDHAIHCTLEKSADVW